MSHSSSLAVGLTALTALLATAGCASLTGHQPAAPTNAHAQAYDTGAVATTTGAQGQVTERAAAAPADAAPAAMGGMCQNQPSEPPQAAGVGQCYARIWNEPRFSTGTQRTLVKPAGTRIEIVPAQYGTVNEQVVVREARREMRVIPAEYETVVEKVVVRPAYVRTETIPAVYDTFEEQVLVKPAYKTWKPGTMTNIQRVDESGQILCLVEVPAEYKTVTRRELRTAEQTRSIEVPAQYQEVEKTVIKTPERTEVTEIPAEYEMREVEKLVQPAREIAVSVEAQYAEVPTQVLSAPGCYAWREILCDTNMTQQTILSVQQELARRGYYGGEASGTFDEETLAAVNEYARANDLPVDPYLNVETAHALGIQTE
jgi:hypothetical protein